MAKDLINMWIIWYTKSSEKSKKMGEIAMSKKVIHSKCSHPRGAYLAKSKLVKINFCKKMNYYKCSSSLDCQSKLVGKRNKFYSNFTLQNCCFANGMFCKNYDVKSAEMCKKSEKLYDFARFLYENSKFSHNIWVGGGL